MVASPWQEAWLWYITMYVCDVPFLAAGPPADRRSLRDVQTWMGIHCLGAGPFERSPSRDIRTPVHCLCVVASPCEENVLGYITRMFVLSRSWGLGRERIAKDSTCAEVDRDCADGDCCGTGLFERSPSHDSWRFACFSVCRSWRLLHERLAQILACAALIVLVQGF